MKITLPTFRRSLRLRLIVVIAFAALFHADVDAQYDHRLVRRSHEAWNKNLDADDANPPVHKGIISGEPEDDSFMSRKLEAEEPPEAHCIASYTQFVVDPSTCTADVSISDYLYDSSVTVEQNPPGPYSPGLHFVTLTVSNSAGSSSCGAAIYVSALELINADSDMPLEWYQWTSWGQGGRVDMCEEGEQFNIHFVCDVDAINSVQFQLTLPGFHENEYHCENTAPYTYPRNSGNDFYGWTPMFGSTRVRTTAYTGSDCNGDVVTEQSYALLRVKSPFSYKFATSGYIGDLNDGGTFTEYCHPIDDMTVIFEPCDSSMVESVEFFYDGKRKRCENNAPYTLHGNDGTNYKYEVPEYGVHNIKVIEWSKNNCKGTRGTTTTVDFEIRDRRQDCGGG